MSITFNHQALSAVVILLSAAFSSGLEAKPNPDKQRIFDYWTPEKMAQATPRDLVIDRQGRGYLKLADGSLKPYGHNKLTQLDAPLDKAPRAKPGGSAEDTTPPSISLIEPATGAVIGASQRFAANVTDASGVRSVTIIINLPSGSSQSFAANNTTGDIWETSLTGFTDGTGWSWQVQAKDAAQGKGNTTTTSPSDFTVETSGGGSDGGSGGGNDDAIANAQWTYGGDVQNAAGRIYFEMPSNPRLKRWGGYVCSGTVATDSTSGRSVIITAAHCVYDDANEAFARNVLFIPNQAETTGSGTDTNCSNDPFGCWAPSFGVVDVNWTTRTFPDNIAWDYAFYVVDDTGAHSGTAATSDALDQAVTSMAIDFTEPAFDIGTTAADIDYTYGLGYSYSDDPNFMHCADNLTTEGTDNWWIAPCGMSGGSSGGPWVQPMNTVTGNGPIISVNSWGYTTSAGMAGPILSGTSAGCIFGETKTIDFASVGSADGSQGVAIDYCP